MELGELVGEGVWAFVERLGDIDIDIDVRRKDEVE
jgi:hypothetical protein